MNGRTKPELGALPNVGPEDKIGGERQNVSESHSPVGLKEVRDLAIGWAMRLV